MKTGNKQMTNSLIPVVSFQRDFLGGSVIKNPLAKAGDMGSIPGSGRSPGEGNGKLTPVFLPGESYGQRSLAGCSPWGLKSRTRLSN